MTLAHDPVGFPTDPYPVRPGTSAALTARTIDATPPPPLVQAQETVAAAIPRITATIGSPLFLTTLGLTLVLVWMTLRLRSRMIGLVLSAMLMMTLTSFRPVGTPPRVPSVGDTVVRESEPPEWFQQREFAPPTPQPAPYIVRVPRRPDVLRPDVDRMRDDEEELRAAIEELRDRIEAELRRRARDHH
jgi:hypothetical protein